MIEKQDFQQSHLFDRIDEILHPKVKEKLNIDWPGVFRSTFLQLIPVDAINKGFSADFGRPTKEHYSICGLLILKEYFGWTIEEAVDNYLFNFKIQYALRIQPDSLQISSRTLDRYLKRIRDNDVAQQFMNNITQKIVDELNINISKQRLDSTHIFSNMSNWTRSMLMYKVLRRFLIQVKRHESKLYNELDVYFRKKYVESDAWLYEKKPSSGKTKAKKEIIAKDMLKIINSFEEHEKLSQITTFKNLIRVFHEQCQIKGAKIIIRKKTGGNVMVNPSDPDATINQKGIGYQAQVSQTYSSDNPVQIVTAVKAQKAGEPDQRSVELMIDQSEKNGAKPKTILADSGYGADENVVKSLEKDVELISPVTGQPKNLGFESFQVDNENKVIKCSRG